MIHKLENPRRLNELDPDGTLKKIGLKAGDVFCDIGAGTGIFAFAAQNLTKAPVYAVEISEQMRGILKEKAAASDVRIHASVSDVPDGSCDIALLCTVLHELPDIPDMSREISRLLRPSGKLAVIEFHQRETPLGPPIHRRISEQDTALALERGEFIKTNAFHLGENFYCLVFEKNR